MSQRSTGTHTAHDWDIRTSSRQERDHESSQRNMAVDSLWIPAATTISTVVTAVYLIGRALTLNAGSSVLLFLIELLAAGGICNNLPPTVPRLLECTHILSIWRRDGVKRPSLHLHGTHVPRVDIFITYCGEGIPLALDTIRATFALDYPPASTRIILLDDSDSSALASAIETRFPTAYNKTIWYTSRREKISGHSKAANLNWGLKYASELPSGAADFFGVLDVDMIPEPHWLRSLLPHMLTHSTAGIVTPPQSFYNTPPDDRYDEALFFARYYAIIMALLDRSSNAMCSGTGFVARRKAIDAIGGFPTESVAEAVLTSWKLKAMGWTSVFVDETVQWGLSPWTIQSFVRQCEKTAIGAVSLMDHGESQREDDGKSKSAFGRTVAVKALLLMIILPYLTGTLNMFLVPWVLVSQGSASLLNLPPRSLRLLISLALADFGAQLLYGFVLRSRAQGRAHVFNHLATLWLAPHQLRALLAPRGTPSGQRKKTHSYVPTNALSEDEKAISDSTYVQRLRHALTGNLTLLHCMVLVLCVAGAGSSIYDALMKLGANLRTGPVESLFRSGILWPPFVLIWTAYIANAWTPVSCLLLPPVRPSRETLLVQDSTADAAYPNQQAKTNWYRKKAGLHLYGVIAYHVVVILLCVCKIPAT